MDDVVNIISPSDIFSIMLSFEGLCQNCQATFGCCEHQCVKRETRPLY